MVTWTNSLMWLMITRQHWKHVRKSIRQRLPSTRISRNTWSTSMQQLVKKQVSARAISSLPCKDITEVCMHPTSTVSVRCIVLWFSQIHCHAKTWSLWRISRCVIVQVRWPRLPSSSLWRKYMVRILSAVSTFIPLWK